MAKYSYEQFELVITDDLVGMRLDKALSSHQNIESRSKATSLIDRGFVKLNENQVKPAHKTVLGEIFSVTLPIEEPSLLSPYDFKLDIIYEDEFLLLVNKPSGLVVHPSFGHNDDTLVNALLHHTNQLANGFVASRPGIVHRIDKDTSGLLVVAKTDRVLSSLAKQFKMKSVHRIYKAVTYGPYREPHGTITSYLKRHPVDRKKFASEKYGPHSVPTGKLAITHYSVIKQHVSGLCLVQLKLETGRTHQIRVHLSELGHPIVSDPVYCTPQRVKSIKSLKTRELVSNNPHLALHAAELGFTHPGTEKNMLFKVEWPDDIRPLLLSLGFNE